MPKIVQPSGNPVLKKSL